MPSPEHNEQNGGTHRTGAEIRNKRRHLRDISGLSETEQHILRLPNAIRIIPDPQNYPHDAELDLTVGDPLYLARGESPLGPPQEYFSNIRKSIDGSLDFAQRGIHYEKVDVSQAEKYVRERYGISEKPYVVFNPGGSDEMIEKVVSLLKQNMDQNSNYDKKTRVIGFGPHFTTIVNIMEQLESYHKGVIYAPLDVNVFTTYDDALKRAENDVEKRKKNQNYVYYLCNPSTPKGEVATPEKLEEFIKNANDRGDLVIMDEAFGDVLPDAESTIKLTEKFDNLIVLRSASKTLGLPGERIGYAVMSPDIGKEYKKIIKPYDIPGPTQLLINEFFKSEILNPHLETTREKITQSKIKLLNSLRDNNIRVLPTDPRTPICLVDGLYPEFYETLLNDFSFDSTPGAGFNRTVPNQSLFDLNRYVRITIPEDESEIPIIASRIKAAIHVLANHYSHLSHQRL